MKNMPRKLNTKQDILNCLELVKTDANYKAADLLKLLDALINRNFIIAVIDEISSDRKTVTLKYCAEAIVNGNVESNGTTLKIKSVEHIDGEPDDQGNVSKESTKVVLSGKLDDMYTSLYIEANPTIYEVMDIAKEEFDNIYSEVKALVK